MPIHNEICQNDSLISMQNLLILYGSQTGNAQDVAERIGRQARRRYFTARVLAMDDFDKTNLINEKLVIFICATAGQGDVPDNMKKFWKFLLRKNLPKDILSEIEFTVFGLGDSSYMNFNFPAKKLFNRLRNLGARAFYPRGDGDDQHYLGYDGTLDPWLKGVWSTLLEKFPLPKGLKIIADDVLPEPSFKLDFVNTIFDKSNEPLKSFTIPMEIKTLERITSSDHFQDVRHVILETTTSDFKLNYNPGDIAILYPKNPETEVQEFLCELGWLEIADNPFILRPLSNDRTIPNSWPQPTTLRQLFINHLDIFSTPRRSFFEFLSYFTSDEQHTEKLREFCTPEGQDDLYAYNQRVKRTIVEVLQDFNSAKIPLDYIFDVFPEMHPRQYSISSSLRMHPNQVHLTIAIVRYKTTLKKERVGVCSRWLETLKVGDIIHVGITKGTMKLPSLIDSPMIFIGPGTGVAPLRSMIQERVMENARDNILFFGCRYSTKDYYYKQDWKNYNELGLLEYFTAFSRDQPNKIYVQNMIHEQSHKIWLTLSPIGLGTVYVSGSADRIPQSVENALKEVFQLEGGLTKDEADSHLRFLEKTKRYQRECWT